MAAPVKASAVTYSDTASQLGATNVQDAVAKLAAKSAAQNDMLASLAARLAKLEVSSAPTPVPVPSPTPTVPATPTIPQQDASGFTVLTPASDARMIYVSSSAGSDGESGLSTGQPVSSLARGLSLVRQGYPDWVLLRAGDAWKDQSFGYLPAWGRPGSEPCRIGSWGTGERPLLKTKASPTADSVIGTMHEGVPNNLMISGIEFYAYDRDPKSPEFNYSTVGTAHGGTRFLTPFARLLIEDCKFGFYTGLTIQGYSGRMGTVILRRSVIADAYGIAGQQHSAGLYVANVADLQLLESFFDHNGWNETVPGAQRTIFNRNLYVQADCGPVTAVGCVFARSASEGAQFRSGGRIENSLFVDNPMGFNLSAPRADTSTATRNVVLESGDMDAGNPRGMGITLVTADMNGQEIASVGATQVTDNIVAHGRAASPYYNSVAILIRPMSSKVSATGNVVYDWKNYDGEIQNQGAGNIIAPNEVNATGYPDPNRSLGSYNGTLGGAATLAAWLTEARKQSKDNWRPAYTADAANSHIRVGFNR